MPLDLFKIVNADVQFHCVAGEFSRSLLILVRSILLIWKVLNVVDATPFV